MQKMASVPAIPGKIEKFIEAIIGKYTGIGDANKKKYFFQGQIIQMDSGQVTRIETPDSNGSE